MTRSATQKVAIVHGASKTRPEIAQNGSHRRLARDTELGLELVLRLFGAIAWPDLLTIDEGNHGHANRHRDRRPGDGFPLSESSRRRRRTYDFFRANLKDKESLQEMEFPAQYMFKQVPDVVAARRRPGALHRREDGPLRHRFARVSLSPNGIRAEAAVSRPFLVACR